MKKYKSISFEAPQGQSMQDYLHDKNLDFLEYLALGARKGIVTEEMDNFKKFLIGGEENEPKVILDNPANPLAKKSEIYNTSWMNSMPQSAPYNADNTLFPQITSPNAIQFKQGTEFSTANNQVPSYVNSFVQANPYDPYAKPPKQPVDHSRRNNNIADISMAGMQTVNSFFDKYYAKQQGLKNQQKMGIENTAQTQYGNRGDYDVNSGILRPDQYTSTYKKGGAPKNVQIDDKIIFNTVGDKLLNLAISENKNNTIKQDNIKYNQFLQSLNMTDEEYQLKYPNEFTWNQKQEETKIKNRFNPDLSGKVMYKKGGEYSINNQSELARLISEGYEFEILD